MAAAKKLALIGIDSATLDFIQRFSQDGLLPNIARLMKRGTTTETVSVLPVGTAENWRTIVTGAYAGTHGVTAMSMQKRGKALDDRESGFFSTYCRAEHLWDVAARVGKRPLLLKYTGSWPPTFPDGSGIQVEGFGDPEWNVHEISPRICFANYDLASDCPHCTTPWWISRAFKTKVRPATGWRAVPASTLPHLEMKMVFRPRDYGLRGRTKHSGTEKVFYALVTARGGNGYDRVAVYESKDSQQPLAVLEPGHWSTWVKSDFQLPEGTKSGIFRMKLMELTPGAEKLRIYFSQIFPASGWTRPDDLAKELLEKIGPYQELSGILGPWLSYWVDEDTILEELEYQAKWLGKAAQYLLSTKDWDMFFTQWHGVDHMAHGFLGGLDPRSVAYDPAREELCWHIIRSAYQLADTIVGNVLDCVDHDTLVVVTSDHGHLPVRAPLSMGLGMGIDGGYYNDINRALERHGLLEFKTDDNGIPVIDWSKTKAALTRGNYIEINLKGREPHGIVDPTDYDDVRDQVIQMLDSLTDPETGDRITCLTVKREDAGFIGLDDESAGDVIFFTKPEYVGHVHRRPPTKRCLSGNHHFYLPDPKFDLGMMHAVTIFRGPGVPEGVLREKPIRMVDIAPTVSWMLGIPAPVNSEGRVLVDLVRRNGNE